MPLSDNVDRMSYIIEEQSSKWERAECCIMMNMLEEAIVYATIMHQGEVRKFSGIPAILHPIEVAQILSTMTDDQEVITAGILHDIVEDTDGTLAESENRFGKRVAKIVASESEEKYPGEDKRATWRKRKEGSLRMLRNSDDIGVRQLWLADKLANMRSLAGIYSEMGDEMWQSLNQGDPAQQLWYYKSVAEIVELQLNRTGAFKEYIKHLNFIWPGTFDSDKARYKKYKEFSIEGCKLLGHGAKGDVYRYDDELVIKVFNRNNLYRDVERETMLARKAFLMDIPTAISFGIVLVDGDRWGAMYELVDSETVSQRIAKSPSRVGDYATMMAEVARTIHGTQVTPEDGFPDASERLLPYIKGGIGRVDKNLAKRCQALIEGLPQANTLVHGDFHTGNVVLQNGEPLIIDMDRLAIGNPIFEIADLHYFYVTLGEDDPSVVENFMGFSYGIARQFFDLFLQRYLGTDDEAKLREVKDKASLLCSSRMIRKLYKRGTPSEANQEIVRRHVERIAELLERVDTLAL